MPDSFAGVGPDNTEVAAQRRTWVADGLIALGYLACYTLLALASSSPVFMGVLPWYLPPGLTLALLLVFGLRFVPVVLVAVFLTSFFLRLLPPGQWLPAILVAVCITAGYTAAAAVLRQVVHIDPALGRLRDVIAFLAVALATAFLVAVCSSMVLVAFGLFPPAAFWPAVLTWWLGDAIGITVLAPVLLTAVFPWLHRWQLHRRVAELPAFRHARRTSVEILLWLGVLIVLLWLDCFSPVALHFSLRYFIFLQLIWLALRYGVTGAALGAFAIGFGTMLAFRLVSPATFMLVDIQLFMYITAAAGLLLGIVVTERERTDRETDRERRRLYTVLHTLPVGVVIADPTGHIVEMNARYTEIWGNPVPEVNTIADYHVYQGWWSDTGERLRAEDWALARAITNGETSVNEIIDILRFDGACATILVSATPIRNGHGLLSGGIAVVQDITQPRQVEQRLRETNRALAVLSHVNEELIRATDEQTLLEAVCRIITGLGGYRLAWVAYYEAQAAAQRLIPIACASRDGGSPGVWPTISPGRPTTCDPVPRVVTTGRPLVVQNLWSDPAFASCREEAQAQGYASLVALPLRGNAHVLGALVIIASTPESFTEEEVGLLTKLANDLGYGITTLRTRIARERAEEELETIFNAVPALIFFKDARGNLLRVNRAFAETMGMTPEALVQTPVAQVFPAHELAGYARDDQEVITTGQPKCGIIEPLAAIHGRRWLETDKLPYRDEHGTIIGIIGFSIDITERKQAEEALATERALLASAMDILPLPIVFFAHDGTVLRYNHALEAFLSTVAQAQWREVQLFTADTHMLLPREEWPVTRALRGAVVSGYEALLRLPPDREVPVLIYAAPVYLNGHLHAAVVVIQDITALKEADRAKTRFLAILSHELRTPLTNILGWAREAREAPELVPEALQVIERNAVEQRQMLEDLLDVSRLLFKGLTLRPKVTELWLLVEHAVEAVRGLVEQRRITLTVTPPTEAMPVNADARRLIQIFWNLLDNAVKYTPSGGTVTISAVREQDHALVHIHDTGRGIPAEQMASLFQPFRQMDRREEVGGLGLGLFLVRGIVELHGGTVMASSPGPGQGSTFTVLLPLLTDTPPK